MATNLGQALLEGSGIVPSLIQELAASGFNEGRDAFHDYIYTKFILGDDRSNSSLVANPGVSVFAASNISNCPDPEQGLAHGASDPNHAGVPSIINCSAANEVDEMSRATSLIKPVSEQKPESSKKKSLQLAQSAARLEGLDSSEIQRKMKKKNPYKKKDKTFVCEVCGRGFAEKYTMNRHMFTHTRIKPYSCSKCKMSFARSDGLAKHIAAGHRRVDSHHCDVCGGTFSSELSFEQHRREYGNTLPFVCNLCMLAFSQCCHLNYHMKSHPLSKLNEGFDYEGEADKNNAVDMSELIPDDCSSPKKEQEDFAVKELLNKLSKAGSRQLGNTHYNMDVFNPHIVIKPEIEEFPTCSSINNRMFADNSINSSGKGSNASDALNIVSLSTSASQDLMNSLAHQGGNNLADAGSDMQGTSKTLNKSAADKENPVSDSEMKKYYDIKIPNPKYRESSSLKGSGMGEDGLFRCDRCGKGFSRKYHMQRHVKLHIRGPVPRAHLLDWTRRPYACGVCKMGFTRQHHLTRHILIHTGERPHSCHVCDKAFRRFTNLTLHIRTVHGAERPFKCHICGRGFPRLYSLQRHQKLHMKNALAASAESNSQLYEGFKPVGTGGAESNSQLYEGFKPVGTASAENNSQLYEGFKPVGTGGAESNSQLYEGFKPVGTASAENNSQLYEGFKPVGTASVEREKSPTHHSANPHTHLSSNPATHLSTNPANTSQSPGNSQKSTESMTDSVTDKYRHQMNTQNDRLGNDDLTGKGTTLKNQEKYILVQGKIHDMSFQNDQHVQNKDQGCHSGEAETRSAQSGQQQVSSPPVTDNKTQKMRLASPHTDNIKLQNSILATMSNFTSSPDHGEVIRSHVNFDVRNVPDFNRQQPQQQTLQTINEDRLISAGTLSSQNLRIINIPVGHEMSLRDASSYTQSHRSGSNDFVIHQQQIQASLPLLNMIERPGSRNTVGQVNMPEAYHHSTATYNQATSSIQIQQVSTMNLPVSCSTMLPGNLQELTSYSYNNHVDIGANHSGVSEPIVYSHNHNASSMPFHAGIHGNYQHHLSDSLDQDIHSHPTPVNTHNMQY
ncbi:unnamed protein product [Candidula unifasciata]|uniref:C2H2-type domain-containing protein n=1 Tax=Candidula unifasciata TaxID=100452 RepID=A0A8S3Z627_9EUPU|nr:unnamed protein product [Candidula unifasciata]